MSPRVERDGAGERVAGRGSLDRAERVDLLRRFGGNLRSLRVDAGLSQEGHAVRTFVRHDQVSAFERGVRLPDVSILLVLADALGEPASKLPDGLPAPVRRVSSARVLTHIEEQQEVSMPRLGGGSEAFRTLRNRADEVPGGDAHDLREQPAVKGHGAMSRPPTPEDPARRLPGAVMPLAGLQRITGDQATPADVGAEWVVYYLYPGADSDTDDVREGPAADRAQHRAFSAAKDRLAVYGVRAAGVSSQTPQEQFETIAANRIDHLMLSDPDLALARTLDLPTFEHHGRTRYRRLTLLTHAREIRWVFHPVENPAGNARQVITWMQINSPAL